MKYTSLLAQSSFVLPYVQSYQLLSNQKAYEHIYALHSNSNGLIYMATDRGIYHFNGTDIQPYSTKYFTNTDYVIFFEEGKNLWALPYSGFIQNVYDTNKLFFFKNEPYQCMVAYKDSLQQSHFLINYQSNFYEGVKNNKSIRLQKLDNYLQFFIHYLQHNFIQKESIDELRKILKIKSEIRIKNNSYLLTFESCYDVFNGKIIAGFDGNKYGFIQSTIVDKLVQDDGSFYLAYMGKKHGLYLFKNNILTPIYTQSDVNAVTKDKYGQIYFSTLGKKLYQIKNEKLLQYNIPNGVEQCVVNKKNIYIKNKLGNIEMLQGQHNLVNSPSMGSYLYTEKDKTYFVCENGLYHLQHNKANFIQKLPPSFFTTVSKKTYQTNSYTNIRIDKKEILYNQKNNTLKKDLLVPTNIYNSYQLNTSTIELNTANGIYRACFDSSVYLQKIKTNTFLDNCDVPFYTEDSNALYYYCEKGIVKHDLQTNTFSTIVKTSPNHPLYDLNNLFVYGNNLIGINQFGLVSYNILTKKMQSFQILQSNTNETLKSGFVSDSLLYFYSNENLYSLPISFLNQASPLPSILFKPIVSNQKIIFQSDTNVQLSYLSKNNIQLSFNVFNLQQDENNAWSYLLIHENEKYSNTQYFDNHQISFNNLPYGSFKLKLFFKQNLVGSYIIYLKPKWHQTWTFKLISLIAILFLLAIGFYYFLRKRNRLKIVKLEQKHKVFMLESSAKLNQLKPHFIFNALTPLQKYIIREDNTNALLFLKDFSVLLRQMLTMSRVEFTTLADELLFIKNYIKIKLEEMSFSFEYSLHSHIHHSNESFLQIPSLFIQPIIENALHYGITNTPLNSKKFIHVTLKNLNETLMEISIEDSGLGFDLKEELSKSKNNALFIIYERLQLLQTHYHDKQIGIKTKKDKQSFTIILTLPTFIKK